MPSIAPGTGQVLRHPSRRCAFPASPRRRPSAVTFARPKSRIFACPRRVTKMLAGLMSRWMMPSRVRGIERVGNLDRQMRAAGLDLQRARRDPVLQRHAVQKLHDDEGAALVLRRCRRWCRCWDDSAPRRHAPRGESVPGPAGRARLRRAGTSARRSGPGECPRPCTPRPCRRRPACSTMR